jgi:hypothetical protein
MVPMLSFSPHRPWLLGAACAVALAIPIARAQTPAAEQQFPDVLGVQVRAAAPGVFNFDVKVSSPYDTPRRYADGFRVTTPSGEVLGERKLWHDHQSEQPFTRDLYAVKIRSGIPAVLVQARDKENGYGGAVVRVKLPGR